jgi:hypothetical protein
MRLADDLRPAFELHGVAGAIQAIQAFGDELRSRGDAVSRTRESDIGRVLQRPT